MDLAIGGDITQAITAGTLLIRAIGDSIAPVFLGEEIDVERIRAQTQGIDSRLLNITVEPARRRAQLPGGPLVLKNWSSHPQQDDHHRHGCQQLQQGETKIDISHYASQADGPHQLGVDVAALLPAMVLWSFKAWFLALAWLGLALGISHFFQTPGKADGFAMLALFVFAVTPSLLRVLDDSDGFAGSLVILRQLFPSAVEDGLWRASFLPVATSAAWLVSLGLLYLSAGYAYFARRDAR